MDRDKCGQGIPLTNHTLQSLKDRLRAAQASTPTAPPSTEPRAVTDSSDEEELAVTGTGRSELPSAAPFLDPSPSAQPRQTEWKERPDSVARPRHSFALVYGQRAARWHPPWRRPKCRRGSARLRLRVIDRRVGPTERHVRTFIADGNFTEDAIIPRPERLDVRVAAVVTVLSLSMASDAGSTRTQKLDGELASGADNPSPPKQRVPE